jgi:hypothetical protein
MWRARRDGGLGALTDPDSWGLRRVFPADARLSRYVALRGTSGRAGLQVPDPQFPNKTPAGHRSSCPVFPSAPGGQPDPTPRAEAPSVEQLRGARCPDDERVQLLADASHGGLAVLAVSARVAAHVADLRLQRTSLPIRSPGQHMHLALCHPPLAGRGGGAGR